MSWGGKREGGGRPRGTGRYGVPTKAIRIPENMVEEVLNFVQNLGFSLPLYSSTVRAGFPSPADDHIETKLDLNNYLIKHPSATFLVRASGDSMIHAGIFNDDLLVVDRSLEPAHGKIVIAAVNGELTVKRFIKAEQGHFLKAENPEYASIPIRDEDNVEVLGVVTNVIHTV